MCNNCELLDGYKHLEGRELVIFGSVLGVIGNPSDNYITGTIIDVLLEPDGSYKLGVSSLAFASGVFEIYFGDIIEEDMSMISYGNPVKFKSGTHEVVLKLA